MISRTALMTDTLLAPASVSTTLNSVFSSAAAAAAPPPAAAGRPWRRRSRQTSLNGLHQVIEFHDRHAVESGQKCVFIECHLIS